MNADMARLASLAHGQMTQGSPQDEHHDDATTGSKRKSEDDQQGQSKARRSRYISLACNECKRRKIKCNGQNPCQRCGNLSLECVYAPNCCNGFKESQEYKDMAAHITSLQEQVNMLFDTLSTLRAQLGQTAPLQQLQSQFSSHQQQPPPIDPSLQSHGYVAASPSSSRPKSQSHNQPPFRGPTSSDFGFGVAKSSLQTMGIHPFADSADTGNGSGSGHDTTQESPSGSPAPSPRNARQIFKTFSPDKDPIWSIPREEALRLCQVYEDEMGLMYPVVDMNKTIVNANKLYRFLEAAHRTGLMQMGFPGPDAIQDPETNILKMVLATALTAEASGRSELGKRLFEDIQPAVDNLFMGSVDVKGIQLLVMTAMYEFHRDNESTSWRIIGLTARLCIELGLHRRETYDTMTDDAERTETVLLFWSVYVLDRRWSFGTGMPFALQDADIDPAMPRPADRSPYLTAMIKLCEIGSKVWRTLMTPSAASVASGAINTEEMDYLNYQVIQWHRTVPPNLRYDHPFQQGRLATPIGPASSRAAHRLRIILYLRANSMRIQIYRPVLHSATNTLQHREQAQRVVDVAKDTIRILTHTNQTSDLYRTQQVLFNAFLTSALAVLFLAVSHTPALFAEDVREEFYMALDLVRGFSKDSYVSKRLWRTIRGLKEIAPKLGLPAKVSANHGEPEQQRGKEDVDPSRSAAVAMAGLAGHNVDEMALFSNGANSTNWNAQIGSRSSPEHMANDLTSLFEAAGGLQAMGQGQGHNGGIVPSAHYSSAEGVGNVDVDGLFASDEGLSHILKELF